MLHVITSIANRPVTFKALWLEYKGSHPALQVFRHSITWSSSQRFNPEQHYHIEPYGQWPRFREWETTVWGRLFYVCHNRVCQSHTITFVLPLPRWFQRSISLFWVEQRLTVVPTFLQFIVTIWCSNVHPKESHWASALKRRGLNLSV